MKSAFDYSSISDVGLRRAENQDRCLAESKLGLFAVADGMGGLPYGAETATAAIDALKRRFGATPPATAAAWQALVLAINAEIATLGRQVSPSTGVGTTLSIAWFGPERRLVTVHVGDSVVLRLRDGNLEQLTEEHTVAVRARKLREQGYEAPEPANAEHILTSCIGLEPLEEIDVREWETAPGDRYLIASDGITKPVRSESIALSLQRAANAKEAGRSLVKLALGAGAPDNATAVVVFVPVA